MNPHPNNTDPVTPPTRRDFLKKSSTAFGFTFLPSYLALGRADAQGNVPPSARVNLACVGVGNRGATVISWLCKGGNAKPVALCDVDFTVKNANHVLNKYPDAKKFADFRKMLEEMGDDIDAVCVATPDHTHFVAAMDAMRRGKHIFVEKPLTHSFRESELLMQAEKKFGVITQMGNQGHTSGGSEQFVHLVNKGIIRDITKIDSWKSAGLWFMNADTRISEFPPEEHIPESLDWDLWCGPAEMKPFNSKYHPFDWRAFHLYGNGMLGDWGAHIIDFAHHWLKLGLPTRIEAGEMKDHNQIIFPLATNLSMHFPARGEGLPACDLSWRDGDGWKPEIDQKYWAAGSEEAPKVSQAGTLLHRAQEDYLIQRASHTSASQIFSSEKTEQFAEDLKVEGPKFDHSESFIQACLGNDETHSPFSVSGELTQVLLLGVACQYLNASLEFDPQTKRFKNNDQANAILDGPTPRKGWEEFYKAI